jgi:Putative zinc-finger
MEIMCDKELLIGYLYGELPASARESFDQHLKSCADCRSEVDGLRGMRTTLQSWQPPEPDLGFQVVRGPQRALSATRWWRPSPAWGLAAAAMLVGAISVVIANVEVTTGNGAITLSMGGNRPQPAQTQASTGSPDRLQQELAALSLKLQQIEGQLVADRSAATPMTAGALPGRMTDAEIARFVRHMIKESEERQQSVLAHQILQMNRDVESARRTDFDRLGRGMVEIQRTAVETFQRQKALEDHLLRVGLQR